jgi:hypothetical protein
MLNGWYKYYEIQFFVRYASDPSTAALVLAIYLFHFSRNFFNKDAISSPLP